MLPRKRLAVFTEATPPEATQARTLPADLLLEIVARTDASTIVRCAACSMALRRDILSPGFIRRVCDEPAGGTGNPWLLGFLHAYDKASVVPAPPVPFSLAHPATPVVTSFSEDYIVRRLSRGTGADVLARYVPLTSRDGLVALHRRNVYRRWRDICVYDLMTGDRALLPYPPDIKRVSAHMYVLLTAADGVGCSFLLLAAEFVNLGASYSIKVQTVSSDAADRKWGAVTVAAFPRRLPVSSSLQQPCCSPVVHGTLIHWLMYSSQGSQILTYDVGTTTAGSIDLPADGLLTKGCEIFNLHLTSSPDGRLRLLVSRRLKVSVWLKTTSSSTGGGWERRDVVDAEEVASYIFPKLPYRRWPETAIEFKGSGARSGAVLLRIRNTWLVRGYENRFVVLDLQTRKMRWVTIRTNHRNTISFPCEVNLMSLLSTMKSFS